MKSFIFSILGLILSTTTAFSADCTRKFSWLPNSETNIAGYKIYYGLVKGGPYTNIAQIGKPTPISGRVFGSVPKIMCEKNYYFVITAYNTTGLESKYSNQVEVPATVPKIINIR